MNGIYSLTFSKPFLFASTWMELPLKFIQITKIWTLRLKTLIVQCILCGNALPRIHSQTGVSKICHFVPEIKEWARWRGTASTGDHGGTNHRVLESKSLLRSWLQNNALCWGTRDTIRCTNCTSHIGSLNHFDDVKQDMLKYEGCSDRKWQSVNQALGLHTVILAVPIE